MGASVLDLEITRALVFTLRIYQHSPVLAPVTNVRKNVNKDNVVDTLLPGSGTSANNVESPSTINLCILPLKKSVITS